MCHAMHNSQTYIRKRHTGNVLGNRHTITGSGIGWLIDSRLKITGNHFDRFYLEHIAHLPGIFRYKSFNGMRQSIQSGRSCQPFGKGIHQFGIYNGNYGNVIGIYANHFLFIGFIGNHIINSNLGRRTRRSRQSNNGNRFVFRICHPFQRYYITEFRIIGYNTDRLGSIDR